MHKTSILQSTSDVIEAVTQLFLSTHSYSWVDKNTVRANCLGSQRVHSLLQSDNQPCLPNYTAGDFLLSIRTLPISRVPDMSSSRVCHPPKLIKFPINLSVDVADLVGFCT